MTLINVITSLWQMGNRWLVVEPGGTCSEGCPSLSSFPTTLIIFLV